jgi:hypothetical protein
VTVQPRQRANSDTQRQGSSRLVERDIQKLRRNRPISWFPPSIKSSGQTSRLHKESTVAAVGKSIISHPILTSTTNADVARAEGVHCGRITASGIITSSSARHSALVFENPNGETAKDQVCKMKGPRDPSAKSSQTSQHPNGISKMSKGSTRRSASMNALSKVKDALFVRLRQASDPQKYRAVFRRDKFVRLGDDCQPLSPADGRMARIKTEGQNLGREKIRVLTGHGIIRRKPVQDAEQDWQNAAIDKKTTLLVDADRAYHTGGHCMIKGNTHLTSILRIWKVPLRERSRILTSGSYEKEHQFIHCRPYFTPRETPLLLTR